MTSEQAASRRRLVRLAAVAVALIAGLAVVTAIRDRDDVARDLPLEAWAPYWALDASSADLPLRADSFTTLSPFWFATTAAGAVGVDPNVPSALAEDFLAAARGADVPLVPSIVDAMPAGGMAAVLRDPAQRALHIDTLVAFVIDGEYAGVDLDYEQFAFADDPSTWAVTRPAWVDFIDELARRLHADGRTLTVSIPPVYDDRRTDESGYWVYDYGAIAGSVDSIRVLAYDFSTATPGPIAPLDWVRRVIEGTSDASGAPHKLVLGIPLYGYNWPVSATGTCPPGDEIGRSAVTARNVTELVELRGATPTYDARDGEWSFSYDLVIDDATTVCTQRREVHFVDAQGAAQRIDLARRAGLGGVALWAFGYDDQTVWDAISPLVRTPQRLLPTPAAIPGESSARALALRPPFPMSQRQSRWGPVRRGSGTRR